MRGGDHETGRAAALQADHACTEQGRAAETCMVPEEHRAVSRTRASKGLRKQAREVQADHRGRLGRSQGCRTGLPGNQEPLGGLKAALSVA